MSAAEKARKTVLGIEIPRDELALRIGIACTGVRPPIGTKASDALDQMNEMAAYPGVPAMGDSFRRAADVAVLYFHERINAARQPS